MQTSQTGSKIIVALDVDNLDKAGSLIANLGPQVRCIKAGLELITAEGAPQVVRFIQSFGGEVFLDGKFKDIPNTVARASAVATKLGVRIFNVHCMGGREMMESAKLASLKASLEMKADTPPLVLGVTLLTSLKHSDLVELGLARELGISNLEELKLAEREYVEHLVARKLAWLAQDAGLDGVVASAQEVRAIKEYCGEDFIAVTPGVRPVWASADDQKRIATPGEAIRNGADMVVIGRPITNPPKEIGLPIDAVRLINKEIEKAISVTIV